MTKLLGCKLALAGGLLTAALAAPSTAEAGGYCGGYYDSCYYSSCAPTVVYTRPAYYAAPVYVERPYYSSYYYPQRSYSFSFSYGGGQRSHYGSYGGYGGYGGYGHRGGYHRGHRR